MRLAVDAAALGSGRGGDETSLHGMLRGLAQVLPATTDHRVHLLLPRDADLDDEVAEHPAFVVHPVRRAGGLARLATPALRRALGDTEVDLLFCQTHAPLRPWAPTVLLVADLSFLHHPETYPRSTRLRLRTLVPRQARDAAMVVTVSEFSRRDLVETLGLDPARVTVVSNPIAPPRALTEEAGATAAARLAERGVTGPFLLYLGNLHPRKNVPRLIDAFLAARQRSTAVAGRRLVVAGAHWWAEGPEQAAAAAAPSDSVVLAGRVDDDEREWLLTHADGVVYPSLFEGFGLPPLEAMARGVPVLTSDRTSLPEVCGDAALLVDPASVAALRDGVVRLVEDDALRERLRRDGPARAATYDLVRTGRELLAALEAARAAGP